jgi:N-dimethylarginine dimethylaminohydrolase
MTPGELVPGPPSEVEPLTHVVLKHVRAAFGDSERIASEWAALNFSAAPDLALALDQYDQFADVIRKAGAQILYLPEEPGVTLDSIYVRDASIVTPSGVVLASMGKPQRHAEPTAQARAFSEWGVRMLGSIEPPGLLEGGDVVWLDARVVAVGEGYRTNAEGIRQFREFLGESIETLLTVPLPHWRGPEDVFHLMSIISPVDRDLAVVYSPLMSVPFRRTLMDRGYRLVEVPDTEFEGMGANVLALSPRRCLMLDGNPETRRRLERAGAEVLVYSGSEISVKGGGGPTCLTRPLQRGDI